ncbi:MAG: 30S ribosomal protein S21 [Chloroflexi bacterium]|nr:30S ribosomal protein S21 [Chloroflexota bacterium]
MVSVERRPNESDDQLFRRFRKEMAKSGKMSSLRRKRWYVSKSEQRRIAAKKSARRMRRRQSRRK